MKCPFIYPFISNSNWRSRSRRTRVKAVGGKVAGEIGSHQDVNGGYLDVLGLVALLDDEERVQFDEI